MRKSSLTWLLSFINQKDDISLPSLTYKTRFFCWDKLVYVHAGILVYVYARIFIY